VERNLASIEFIANIQQPEDAYILLIGRNYRGATQRRITLKPGVHPVKSEADKTGVAGSAGSQAYVNAIGT
jgi:hypothetical protein